MNSDKSSTAKTILACAIGDSVWLLLYGATSDFLHYLGVPSAVAQLPTVIPSLIVGVRIGMTIRTGKINGGVSKEKNILIMKWFIFFLIMGAILTITEILLDMTPFPKGNPFISFGLGLLFIGAGALILVKMRLVTNDTE